MTTDSVWRRKGFSLVPWSAEARDALLAVPEGGQCAGQIWVPRHPARLTAFYARLTEIAEGIGEPVKKLEYLLKIRLGIYEFYFDSTGRKILMPGSISLDSMDEVAFQSFLDHVGAELSDMTGVALKDMRREFKDATRGER